MLGTLPNSLASVHSVRLDASTLEDKSQKLANALDTALISSRKIMRCSKVMDENVKSDDPATA